MTADLFIKKSLLTILILLVAGLAFFAVWQMGNRGQSTLTDSQKVLYKQYFALAANRTAYMELSNLDVNSPSYSSEKANVFEQIERTNSEAVELIRQAKDNTFSIEGVGERYQEMVEESIAVLKVQLEIFQEYKRIEEIVSITYTYDPSFITLETDLDDEELLANIMSAREEFMEIRAKLEDLDGGAMAVSEGAYDELSRLMIRHSGWMLIGLVSSPRIRKITIGMTAIRIIVPNAIIFLRRLAISLFKVFLAPNKGEL